jgi:LytS/YehU family sensor histidine kinase
VSFCFDLFNAAGWQYWLFFLLSLTLVLVLFRTREVKLKKDVAKEISRQQALIHLEMNAFQAQMNPHFIFNSLNAIHHYILTTSTDLASLYLTRFARLMRLVIRNCNKEWVNLEEDVEALELYLQLEQLRFGPQFDYQLEVLPAVSQQITFVPPLLIQPYVQDVIWRRLLLRPGNGGMLSITIDREGDSIAVYIVDNGTSQEAPDLDQQSYLTKGISIAAERLQAINEKYHIQASITEEDITEGEQLSGHRIRISMIHINSRLAPANEG